MSAASLLERLRELVPARGKEIASLRKAHGKTVVDHVTLEQILGGMRGIKCMLWETSQLDALEGIRMRGYTLPELRAKLPSAVSGGEPMAEGVFWLLLTGELPSEAEVAGLAQDLRARGGVLPAHVEAAIRAFPKGMHPMTQLSSALLALQTESAFAKAYAAGVHKRQLWELALEDSLSLLALLPRVCGLIYRCTYGGRELHSTGELDYAAGLARMLGFD
eukprot:CAMPEP_0183345658 /NCGR_PEP_ID=MMETSP0164_2-20130417/11020_1 /TAXON_ID=221442 /ORGANISM="Coccolithus pelagicus ssp braarudi, Strain PLY182g" /LENGTH=219 /DNA_ID=CAMNT_0025516825 /DNA_START=14 /DNA_END=670 /DNA_ORIENTATION=-